MKQVEMNGHAAQNGDHSEKRKKDKKEKERNEEKRSEEKTTPCQKYTIYKKRETCRSPDDYPKIEIEIEEKRRKKLIYI